MSKFRLTVGATNLAAQIANLLNAGQQLGLNMTDRSIILSPTEYIVEMDREKVIGVIGLDVYLNRVTELKHLCVHPDYRRQGLGIKLLEKGVEAATTEFVYGAVGSDNHTNIRNNIRIGMKPVGKRWGRGRYIIIFARRKHRYGTVHN